jgi:hypothetical protein
LVFVPILNIFQLSFFAGPLLTCVFGALSLIFLNLILLQFDIPARYRWILLALTQIYPSFLYTSTTGTTEAVFLFITLFVIWGALQITRNNMAFLICGFGLAVGFFVKYESVALTAGIILALIIFEWHANENWRAELEGRFISFITPIVYAIGLWIIFNGLNQADPFYFLENLFTPAYAPAVARNASVLHPFFLGWENLFEAVRIGVQRVWQSSLVFSIAILLAVFLSITSKRRNFVSVLIIIFSIPALDISKIFLGLLPPWLYQWAFVVPFSVILAGMFFQDVRHGRRDYLIIAMIILTGVSMVVTMGAMGSESVSYGEQRIHALITGDIAQERSLRESDPYWVYRHDAPLVANALDKFAQEGTILVNASNASPITLFSQDPGQIIITDEIDFQSFFEPPGASAGYVLLLQTSEPINPNYGIQEYPALSEANVNYATQVWSSNQTILDWRIYQISFE